MGLAVCQEGVCQSLLKKALLISIEEPSLDGHKKMIHKNRSLPAILGEDDQVTFIVFLSDFLD